MTTLDFLSYLRRLDIKLWVEDGRLRFSAPPAVLTAELRAELTNRKAEIVAMLRTAEGVSHAHLLPIAPVERHSSPLMSFAQQRLWFLNQWNPGNPAYNIPYALRIGGPLDSALLQRVLNDIVQRHEELRTTFATRDGIPVQIIAPLLHIKLPVVDMRHVAPTEREARIRQALSEEARRPFDLARGPLLRVALLYLADEDYVLFLNMHHTIADGWSLRVFFRELATLYNAYHNGESTPLEPLPIQYADFAHWQRQWLQGDILNEQLAYWQQQLGRHLTVLDMPTDRPRPAIQTFSGAIAPFVLPRPLTAALTNLSQQHGVTLFMLLLAAFNVLLHRYTNQTVVIVGSPIANRTRGEIEGLIGCFVNTLVLRANLAGDPSFTDVLAHIREVALEAYAHQDVPFEQLVELLQPERDLSRQPLFQVMFALQNAPVEDIVLAGLRVKTLHVHNNTAKFDLSLEMQETAEGLIGFWEYNTDLFDARTLTRMTRHWQTLLAGIVSHPEQQLSLLPLLSETERHQTLITWNNTGFAYPTDRCLHHLLEEQAARTPDAVALDFEGQQMTYRNLDRSANRVAHYLRRLGVTPGRIVGICIDRSLDMVVGLLGILKAGAAYVPLDPGYPKERLAFMLKDSGAAVLLTQKRLASHLPARRAEDRIQMVRMDTDCEAIARENDSPPASAITSDYAAYVIYTSGSTGKPKGVMISHRAIVNHMTWMQRTFPLSETDRVLQKTPFSFDASVWEFYAPLLVGARLVIARPEGHQDSTYMVNTIAEQQITTLQLVPTLLRLLLEEPGFERCTSLRRVFCGGEVLPTELQDRFFKMFLQADLCNLYGPTEATIEATFQVCSRETPAAEWSVPIGRPIANTQIYLLNAALNAVPIGVPGEIYISGDCLAHGYLNRADLTAEQFLPNPFSRQPGNRMYHTGDLGRYRADGTIEFIGRADHQVKIRGFRIEPGEIEAVLLQHPGVAEAVVVSREDEPGNRRLVAYIVAQTAAKHRQPEPESQEQEEQDVYLPFRALTLRDYLHTRLPDYMLPAAFVFLNELPLTPNGKVNRQALPAPETTRPDLAIGYTAPRTPVEEILARIWAEVLGIEQVGIHDNFFDLGGHSLQTMQLVSKIATALGCDISIRTIFTNPTIAALARSIEQQQPADAAPWNEGSLSTASQPRSIAYQPSTPLLTIERRPLLPLVATGQLPPADAVTLSYLEPVDPLAQYFRRDWSEGLPILREIADTPQGRVAIILLPLLRAELYESRDQLIRMVIESLEMGRYMGARMMSLAGLIPSATDYGHAIQAVRGERPDLPRISTGHATTTATVVLNMGRIVHEAGRSMGQERVVYVGLGSVGAASLRLMLRSLPHPAELLLCDLYSKREALEEIQQEIIEVFGFRGPVRVLESQAEVPPDLYEATLIVGATNVPDIVDISQVQPGTLIVDDSAPHCFNTQYAIQRFESHADILFTEGGVLQTPQLISRVRHLPRAADYVEQQDRLASFFHDNPQHITGCVFSSLLSARFDDLTPTVGLVPVEASQQHYERLQGLGYQAAALHCEAYTLDAELIERFRQQKASGDRRGKG